MSTEVEVVKIEAAPGATPVKVFLNSGRQGYGFPIIYTLEDGRTVESRMSSRLLRDAKSELASLPKVPKGLRAKFSDDGEYWGTVQSYYMGPKGLESEED